MKTETQNFAQVIGKVVKGPVKSHQTEGENFYELTVEVKRLSDTFDYIPVTISERLFAYKEFNKNEHIAVIGEFRSYNKQENDRSKLILHLFAKELYLESEFNEIDTSLTNNVVLSGYLCKEPIYRVTPFKREICDALIAVNRRSPKSDYIPCIFWGRNARFMEKQNIGTKINFEGRIQSRIYLKKYPDGTEQEKTAYEISVSKIRSEEQNLEEKFVKNEEYKEFLSSSKDSNFGSDKTMNF